MTGTNTNGAALEWTPALETGVTAIDNEHRQLIDLLKLIRSVNPERQQKLVATPLLAQLYQMFATHFTNEERVMRGVGYPQARDHGFYHQVMLGAFNQSLADLKSGRVGAVADVVALLEHWIVGHIDRDDRLLVEFLRRQPSQVLEEAQKERPPQPEEGEAIPAGLGGLLRQPASRR